MRYVGYIRISSEEQRGNYSLAAQKHAIQSWVTRQQGPRAGSLTQVYEDECFTGLIDNRPAFQQMMQDARQGKFDAIVIHKWDRLARLRCDAIRYKVMLRREYGIKLFAVEGVSEDEDEYMGMFFEAMTEVWDELYSRNLSRETKKGKYEKAQQGRHNNMAPFGADQSQEGILCPNPKEQPGLMLAMEAYSTSQRSDRQVATVLNTAGYVTKQGKPFTAEMVREMLQNRTYIGLIRYQPYRKHSDGSRDNSSPTEWFPGQHKPIVPVELFERCQEVRRRRQHYPRGSRHGTVYPLSGLLYCKHCGKRLRAQKTPSGKRYYHCIHPVSDQCAKRMVLAETWEQQVAHLLLSIDLPDNSHTMNHPSAESYAQSDQRRNELLQSVERLDFRWDMCFIEQDEYMAKRKALQQQLRNNQPFAERELIEAESLLKKFKAECETANLGHQKEFFVKMIESIQVCGGTIKAIKLRPPFTFLARHATHVQVDAEGFLTTRDAV